MTPSKYNQRVCCVPSFASQLARHSRFKFFFEQSSWQIEYIVSLPLFNISPALYHYLISLKMRVHAAHWLSSTVRVSGALHPLYTRTVAREEAGDRRGGKRKRGAAERAE